MSLLRRAPSEAPPPPEPPGTAGAFTDPQTRMLLAGEGLTTPLLEAMLNTRLRVRVLHQEVTGADAVPAEIAGLLGVGAGEEVLVRRSSLLDPRSSPVTLNYVVGRHRPGDPALDLHTPLGYSVLGRGLSQRRRIVHVGRDAWRRGTGAVPCAVKAYLMLIEDEPAFYVRECFNPDHVSAAVSGGDATGHAHGPAAERLDGSGSGSGPSPPPLPPEARHQPAWRDEAALRRCRARLRALPPLITRVGAGRAARLLPPLLRAGRDSGVPVTWVCDPMHGNGRTTAAGRRFCRVGDVVAEIRAFFAAHRRVGTRPGGLHLETAPEDVTECAGGRQRLEERDLDRAYRTLCDPRLNPAQTVDCVLATLAEIRAGGRDRAAG
ncbi:3-deoxy-7-phosphoheptulonate synthase [Actinomadura sp. 21ATH]|uniref:3-deoxy-7-phosphoheptulonate synthase n=1 Tax=Actinomadura sp. 21ATH TaxID=1735444 RepID=UPI0035BF000A